MEQHFEVGQALHDIEHLCFSDDERPDEAEKGEIISLNLVSSTGEQRKMTAEVAWRENYPNGYEMICQVVELPRTATVIVDKNHPEMDGVRLQLRVPAL